MAGRKTFGAIAREESKAYIEAKEKEDNVAFTEIWQGIKMRREAKFPDDMVKQEMYFEVDLCSPFSKVRKTTDGLYIILMKKCSDEEVTLKPDIACVCDQPGVCHCTGLRGFTVSWK